MITTETMSPLENNDAELVSHSLQGSREAFGQIVARYQALICSLAYSSTGSLTQSEDLAQETFVTAWKQLSQLREPAKLRSWLCGIARNLNHRTRRGQEREPSHEAEQLETMDELPALEHHPLDEAISREEESILWRSLERIPETYREPLILFYREHESVEQVARALELSEDAVRQRLVRGRKLLHEQVLAFIEGALKKTSPGRTFTVGVLAVLPLVTPSAKAATIGATLAKGGAAVKSAAVLGTLGGWFAMLGGAFVTLRAQADDTKSPRERQFVLQMIGIRLFVVMLLGAACFGIGKLDFSKIPSAPEILRSAYIFACYVLAMGLFVYSSRRQQQIQMAEQTFEEAEWTLPRRKSGAAVSPKSNVNLQAIKFKALGLVVTGVMIFEAPWKQHMGHAVLWSAALALAFFWSFRSWQNRPRYQSLRSGWVFASPIIIGLITLFLFNLHQYQAQAGSDDSSIASPTEVCAFNLVTGLAYAAFIGILAWKRNTEFRSSRYFPARDNAES
jgi:RNA polymerase sigma factor (sigma-70 family)